MSRHNFLIVGSIAIAVCAAGCSSTARTPTHPTTTSTTAEVADVTGSVTVPQAVSPAANAVIRNGDQPVTLTVTNAVATKGPNTYDFEVASDTGFANKVGTMM